MQDDACHEFETAIQPRHKRGGGQVLTAVVAVAAEKDLSHLADVFTVPQTPRGQANLIQAGDRPTVDANEVGMALLSRFGWIDGLEPPNVIPQFATPQKASFGQVIQVSECGGLVDATAAETIGHFGVGPRSVAPPDNKERSHASRSCPQPRTANLALRRLDLRSFVVRFAHGTVPAVSERLVGIPTLVS